MTDLTEGIGAASRTARIVKTVTIGMGIFDPAYPYHGAIHRCPFCGQPYRVHGGFADHRDECKEGPNPGSNPAAPVGDDSA